MVGGKGVKKIWVESMLGWDGLRRESRLEFVPSFVSATSFVSLAVHCCRVTALVVMRPIVLRHGQPTTSELRKELPVCHSFACQFAIALGVV